MKENKVNVIIIDDNPIVYTDDEAFLKAIDELENSGLDYETFINYPLNESPVRHYTRVKYSFIDEVIVETKKITVPAHYQYPRVNTNPDYVEFDIPSEIYIAEDIPSSCKEILNQIGLYNECIGKARKTLIESKDNYQPKIWSLVEDLKTILKDKKETA